MVGSTQSDAPNLAILSLSAFGSVSAGRRAGTAYYLLYSSRHTIRERRATGDSLAGRRIVWSRRPMAAAYPPWGVASYQLETFARAKRRKPMGATNVTQSGF